MYQITPNWVLHNYSLIIKEYEQLLDIVSDSILKQKILTLP